MAMKKTKQIHS